MSPGDTREKLKSSTGSACNTFGLAGCTSRSSVTLRATDSGTTSLNETSAVEVAMLVRRTFVVRVSPSSS